MNELALSPSAQLKAGTQALHYQLDHQSVMQRLVATDITLAEYAALLQRMWHCYRVVEAALDAFALAYPALAHWADPAVYRRTPDIERDLHALQSPLPQGNPAHTSTTFRARPLPVLAVSSAAQAAGCLYVLGGARMGARVIERSLRHHLGAAVAPALQFFEAGQVGDRQEFAVLRATLDSALQTPAATQEALEKAGEVFRVFLSGFAQGG